MSKLEDARKRGVSRQRLWQIKMEGIGRCRTCGRKRKQYAVCCDKCQEKVRTRWSVNAFNAYYASGEWEDDDNEGETS